MACLSVTMEVTGVRSRVLPTDKHPEIPILEPSRFVEKETQESQKALQHRRQSQEAFFDLAYRPLARKQLRPRRIAGSPESKGLPIRPFPRQEAFSLSRCSVPSWRTPPQHHLKCMPHHTYPTRLARQKRRPKSQVVSCHGAPRSCISDLDSRNCIRITLERAPQASPRSSSSQPSAETSSTRRPC